MEDIVKDIILAEYNSLREEAIQRAGTQSTVIGWLIGLTGTFVGLNIVLVPSGMTQPIILQYFFQPNKEVIALFAFLCSGYTVSVELLLSFWIYQLFHMFRIARYLMLMEKRLKEYLNIDENMNILSWERESSVLRIYDNGKNSRFYQKIPIAIASCSQPLSLYVLSFLGITGIISSVTLYCIIESRISIIITIIYISIIIFLSTIMLALFYIHLSLIKWVTKTSYFPFRGLFRK